MPVYIVNKPLGLSSHDVVSKSRKALKTRKVGHAGTLDPLATGLLLICTGKFTKTIPNLQGQIKEYTGTITLGATTPSYDLETEADAAFPIDHITEEDILQNTKVFMGTIDQIPPVFSALKKDGKRLYEYARDGIEVEVKKRSITIFEFEIVEIKMPEVKFRVVCSKGTYIRSLAHDFGKALHSGGHLSALRRTKIGDYNVNKAVDPAVFAEDLLGKQTNS